MHLNHILKFLSEILYITSSHISLAKASQVAQTDFSGKGIYNPLLERGNKYLWTIVQSAILIKHNYQQSISS